MTLGVGVLWLMEVGMSFEENVNMAIVSFRRFYPANPTYVHMNPADIPVSDEDPSGTMKTVMGLPIVATRDTLKGHIFVGRDVGDREGNVIEIHQNLIKKELEEK
jgi:hypothetical protein